MSPNEINVIAVMRPRQGKTQQALELLKEAAANVEKDEEDTTRYEIYSSLRTAKDGTDLIFMVERYKNKQALKEHGESAAFKRFQKGVADQDLMLGPPTIHVLSQRGGFDAKL